MQPTAAAAFTGQQLIVDKLWREFFADPSEWWDHRSEKVNARYPDFKHKQTQKALWLNGKLNPPWVERELAVMAAGSVQSNIFSWNRRLARFVEVGQDEKTIELFQKLQQEGMTPDTFTFVSVLKACASLRSLQVGRNIHTDVIRCNCDSDIHVSTSLIDMYAKCGSLEDAWEVFNKMPTRDVITWNTLIHGLVKCGQGQKALELSHKMKLDGVEPVPVTFVALLNACASVGALEEGQRVHQQTIQSGYESYIFVCNSLVDMYVKCGSMEDAWNLFNKTHRRNVVTWNTMIVGLVKHGQGRKALETFQRMQQEGLEPDHVTFVGLLNACAGVAAIDEGRRVHEQIRQGGYESDVFIGSSLIDMYSKCGSIEDAWKVFKKMPIRNVVTWNAMIMAHVRYGQGQNALILSERMQQEGFEPDHVTYVGLLNACASLSALEEGRSVHKQIEIAGKADVFVYNGLIDMYVKCGSIEEAWRVFGNMGMHNVVSWNTMILGFVRCGQPQKALQLSGQMQREGMEPSLVTFIGLLNACASAVALEEGKRLHGQIIQSGCESDVYIGSGLVDMYAKCGSIEDAWRVFKRMPMRNEVSWSTMILGLVRCGQAQKALELASQMQQEGVEPTNVTFVGMLNACACIGALEEGRRISAQIIQRGCESDVVVGSGLVDMYAKCGSIKDAWEVFNKMPMHDMASWNAMILGLVKCGENEKALELSRQMQEEGVVPDMITYIGILNACASLAALDKGRDIHMQIIQSGCLLHSFVGNSLIDMYAKCGSIEDAWKVFDKMPTRDVVSWNAMIQGYVRCGQARRALKLYQQMEEGVKPDDVTFVVLLNACANIGSLEEGRRVEMLTNLCGWDSSVHVGNSVIDMYAKCGSIEEAKRVFDKMPKRDLVSWNTLLGGYAMHGHGRDACRHFKQMSREGVEMDRVTFISLLSACNHAGLVDEGMRYFGAMSQVYGISASMEHYACTVDLLGRAGHLYMAENLVKRMSHTPGVTVWMSLLSACRIHGNMEMGERVARQIINLNPQDCSGYILLSNMYATAEWDQSAIFKQQRLEFGVKKQASTQIEVAGEVYSFVTHDQEHSQIAEIHAELERLSMQMMEIGYCQRPHSCCTM